MNLKTYLIARQKMIDRALDRFLPKENAPPPTIHKAMRYSLFVGGKRLRPILCLAAAEGCKGKLIEALPLACAMECIHTYSLVHDDLPSMDNDDFRRGRATCHKVSEMASRSWPAMHCSPSRSRLRPAPNRRAAIPCPKCFARSRPRPAAASSLPVRWQILKPKEKKFRALNFVTSTKIKRPR